MLPKAPLTTSVIHDGTVLPYQPDLTLLEDKQCQEDAIVQHALRILEQRFVRSDYLTSPNHTRDYLTLTLANEPREVFGMVLLDNRHGVLGFEILFYGTIDGASVYPREVVTCALNAKAAAVILVSGNPEPSQDDCRITGKITTALKTVDIRTLDHIIVAGASSVSMAERGLMP